MYFAPFRTLKEQETQKLFDDHKSGLERAKDREALADGDDIFPDEVEENIPEVSDEFCSRE